MTSPLVSNSPAHSLNLLQFHIMSFLPGRMWLRDKSWEEGKVAEQF